MQPDLEEIKMRCRSVDASTAAIVVMGALALLDAPVAHADNKRFNDGIVANIYTIQHQAGCTNDVKINRQLQLAAQWHTNDVLNNRALNGDIGSDGSTPQNRAQAAGYHGRVDETVAIHPATAISGVELMNQWYHNPDYFGIMSNCANSEVGVWSENSLDRTVVVAVYGQQQESTPQTEPETSPLSQIAGEPLNAPISPMPDYDGSDEIEYVFNWLPWILRGVYPPPATPPQ